VALARRLAWSARGVLVELTFLLAHDRVPTARR
jgi:hypothetical protein